MAVLMQDTGLGLTLAGHSDSQKSKTRLIQVALIMIANSSSTRNSPSIDDAMY
jgi:hypothetical protein